jgi:hypothetical protein
LISSNLIVNTIVLYDVGFISLVVPMTTGLVVSIDELHLLPG